jgi:flagellar assembly protein FliH
MATDVTEPGQKDWIFPDMDNYKNPDEEYTRKLNQALREQVDIKNELEKTKKSYEEKLTVVNELFQLVEDPVGEVSQEVLTLFHDILRKIAKKILLKEIEVDKSRLKVMVEEVRQLVKSQKDMVTVCVSPKDAENFAEEKDKLKFRLTVDDTLATGDIMVKSQVSEIRAILSDRIDQLIKANYD